MSDPKIIDPRNDPRPVNGQRTREIKIEWNGDTPQIGHLTGTGVSALLHAVLANRLANAKDHAERQRAQLANNILIALTHRDCARGLVDMILAEFAALTPSWERLTWAWAIRVREENAMRERSRVAPRVARESTAIGGRLTLVQKQQAGKLRARGKSCADIANALDVKLSTVRWYFEQKRRRT